MIPFTHKAIGSCRVVQGRPIGNRGIDRDREGVRRSIRINNKPIAATVEKPDFPLVIKRPLRLLTPPSTIDPKTAVFQTGRCCSRKDRFVFRLGRDSCEMTALLFTFPGCLGTCNGLDKNAIGMPIELKRQLRLWWRERRRKCRPQEPCTERGDEACQCQGPTVKRTGIFPAHSRACMITDPSQLGLRSGTGLPPK